MKRFLALRGSPNKTYGDGPLSYDGVATNNSRAKKRPWVELTSAISGMGASPYCYISFHFNKRSIHAPTPYQLCADLAINEYRLRGLVMEETDIKRRLAVDVHEFKLASSRWVSSGYSSKQSWRLSLMETSSGRDISPLFRYCLSVQLNLAEVSEQWKELAQRQYSMNPRLIDRLWSDIMAGHRLEVEDDFSQEVIDDLSGTLSPAAQLPLSDYNPLGIRRA